MFWKRPTDRITEFRVEQLNPSGLGVGRPSGRTAYVDFNNEIFAAAFIMLELDVAQAAISYFREQSNRFLQNELVFTGLT